MEAYPDAKDTRETDSFPFDWSPRLGEGETIVSLTVTMIDAAGTTLVQSVKSDAVTRVYLSGGTAGATAIWLVSILTNSTPARTIDQDFSVEIVDKAIAEAAETTIERLTRQIAEAELQRHSVGLGEAVVEVWRDGRRVIRKISTMAELERYIALLRSELTTAQTEAGETPTRRRRAISLAYRN